MVSLSLADPVVQSYIFYSSVLALKMMGVAILTSRQRYRKKVFANEEDVIAKKGKLKLDDPDVERVRRAHRNDLENIPAFWVVGALYLTTGPAAAWATTLFRAYAAGRVLHTVVYAMIPLPQPTRCLVWLVPFLITIYMAVQVILQYAAAM